VITKNTILTASDKFDMLLLAVTWSLRNARASYNALFLAESFTPALPLLAGFDHFVNFVRNECNLVLIMSKTMIYNVIKIVTV